MPVVAAGRLANLSTTMTDSNVQVALEETVRKAMAKLGCENWDCDLWLTTDKTIRRLNALYRGKDASTDILSFSMNEVSICFQLINPYLQLQT